jgi:DNA-binding NarL/FixJ family response regulator
MRTTKKDITTDILHLLVVDDHKMVRDGIRVMLDSLRNHYYFEITEAESGEEALKEINRKDFDLIIIDYKMPGINGAETVARIRLYKPSVKILALSNYDEYAYIESMVAAGAMGYILKDIDPSQLLAAIKTLQCNKPYYSNEVAVKLIEATQKPKLSLKQDKYKLTKRELEVLKMIAMEMTNEEIAKKLYVGKRTVDSHRQNLLNKLHVKNTVGLVKAAYQLNLINP